MKVTSSTVFVGAVGLGVLIAVASGLAVIGTPENIRLQRLDDARSQDLQNIANTIRIYRTSHNTLPEQLERVQDDGSLSNLRFKDAETGSPYEYMVVDASSYELCAQFATVSDDTARPFGNSIFWKHPRGRHCFAVQATDPRIGGGRGVTF